MFDTRALITIFWSSRALALTSHVAVSFISLILSKSYHQPSSINSFLSNIPFSKLTQQAVWAPPPHNSFPGFVRFTDFVWFGVWLVGGCFISLWVQHTARAIHMKSIHFNNLLILNSTTPNIITHTYFMLISWIRLSFSETGENLWWIIMSLKH